MFTFKHKERQEQWEEFHSRITAIFEEKVKPILREPPTSDIALMVHKLEFLSGWLPWLAEQRVKAEMFYKVARAEALEDCPYPTPELKVRIWLEGEIAEVEYFYNHLSAVYSAATDSGMKLQTALRVESELLGQRH